MGVRWTGDDETTEVPFCAAYPNGIPNDIAYGNDKHEEIRSDQDNNIVFEKDVEPETVNNALDNR
jgi:hypothetical protein